MRTQILFTIGSIFLATAVVGQSAVEKFVFHTSIEKEVINGYTNSDNGGLALYLIADESLTESQLDNHHELINSWTDYFTQKKEKAKSSNQFLSHLFYKVHRRLLKNYMPFTSFNTTLNSGDYDCLSATTLYGILLSNLNIDFEIVETNYHIYLKMIDEHGNIILFESTDPMNGFIDNKVEIQDRLNHYGTDNNRVIESDGEYTYKADVNRSVGMTGLVGLHYYNAAVKAFNNGEITQSVPLFEKARLFYNSQRLSEFGFVLSQRLLSSDKLSKEINRNLMRRLSSNNENVVSIY